MEQIIDKREGRMGDISCWDEEQSLQMAQDQVMMVVSSVVVVVELGLVRKNSDGDGEGMTCKIYEKKNQIICLFQIGMVMLGKGGTGWWYVLNPVNSNLYSFFTHTVPISTVLCTTSFKYWTFNFYDIWLHTTEVGHA